MFKNDWNYILKEYLDSEEFNSLIEKVNNEYNTKKIFPIKEDLFNAFNFTSYKNLKVVIMGQDPYHGENQAHGLSFSVKKGTKIPPSLRNIYKELHNDLGLSISENGDLTSWAKEGVLLLNSTLTVEKGNPNSHKDLGWNHLTDYIIKKINEKESPVVFILWGNFARSKKNIINDKKHLILESTHPSPFSAYNGFFGSKPFSKTNKFLIKNKKTPINWLII